MAPVLVMKDLGHWGTHSWQISGRKGVLASELYEGGSLCVTYRVHSVLPMAGSRGALMLSPTHCLPLNSNAHYGYSLALRTAAGTR